MLSKTLKLRSGETVPVLGQGTWRMAENPARRGEEIVALRTGLDLGLTLVDTAEMYASGAAEELVGEAIANRRSQVFLVGKVLPTNSSRRKMIPACEASLRRLGTDHLDLYLLHWRGSVPLEETVNAFETLIHQGKIRHWGVSNFDVADMEDIVDVRKGTDVTANQVLYNLKRRGIEWDLLPWSKEQNIPLMAYSPVEQGELVRNPGLDRIAKRHNAAPSQIALSWVLRQNGVIAIPKAGTPAHVRENHGALGVELSEMDISELDSIFAPPTAKAPLEII